MKGKGIKKGVLIGLVLLVAGCMALPVLSAREAGAAEIIHLRFGGSTIGSNAYTFCALMADLWKRNIPGVEFTLIATAGSMANHGPIDRGELDIASSATPGDMWAMQGKYFTKTKLTNFCSLLPTSVGIHHALVYADSPIKSWKDLDGKRVALGAKAAPGALTSEEIFSVLNIQPKFIYSTPAEAGDMVKDRRVDALVYGVGAPWSMIMDISKSVDVRLVPMEAEDLTKVVQAIPCLFATKIAANTYSFQKEDVPGLGAYPDIIVRPGLPEELVYQLTKVAWENWAEVGKSLATTKAVSPKDMVNMVAPIHPGGVRYLKEIGIQVPDRLIWKK